MATIFQRLALFIIKLHYKQSSQLNMELTNKKKNKNRPSRLVYKLTYGVISPHGIQRLYCMRTILLLIPYMISYGLTELIIAQLHKQIFPLCQSEDNP